MGKKLEVDIRKVDLSVVVLSTNYSRKSISMKRTELTKQKHDSRAMGKFQNVPLFSFLVKTVDLSTPCHHVEPNPRDDQVNMELSQRDRRVGSRGWDEDTDHTQG